MSDTHLTCIQAEPRMGLVHKDAQPRLSEKCLADESSECKDELLWLAKFLSTPETPKRRKQTLRELESVSGQIMSA